MSYIKKQKYVCCISKNIVCMYFVPLEMERWGNEGFVTSRSTNVSLEAR